MASFAKEDQQHRKIEVNRNQLLETLESNKIKHIAEYEEALAGYKELLLEKIDKAFENARQQLDNRHKKLTDEISSLSDEDIVKQKDFFTIVNPIDVEMKVPRSYVKEYDAAIDIARWDVRDTLILTYAEFTCFVRDEWDWKSGFNAISKMYRK